MKTQPNPGPLGLAIKKEFEACGVYEGQLEKKLLDVLPDAGDLQCRVRNIMNIVKGKTQKPKASADTPQLFRDVVHALRRIKPDLRIQEDHFDHFLNGVNRNNDVDIFADFAESNKDYYGRVQHLAGTYLLRASRPNDEKGAEVCEFIFHISFENSVPSFLLKDIRSTKEWAGRVFASAYYFVCIGRDTPRQREMTSLYFWYPLHNAESIYGLEVLLTIDNHRHRLISRRVMLVRGEREMVNAPSEDDIKFLMEKDSGGTPRPAAVAIEEPSAENDCSSRY